MAGVQGAMKKEAAGACQSDISEDFSLKANGIKRWQLWFLKPETNGPSARQALAAKAV
jgi:hypothetical protein